MPRIVSNKAQLEKLVSLMEANEDLARGVCPKNVAADRWAQIAVELNSIGPPVRADDVWQKVWKDLKYKTKKKLTHNRSEVVATGGGPNQHIALTAMDEAIALLLRYDAYVQPEGLEFGAAQPEDEGEVPTLPLTPQPSTSNGRKRKYPRCDLQKKFEMVERMVKSQEDYQNKILDEMREIRQSQNKMLDEAREIRQSVQEYINFEKRRESKQH